MDSPEPVRARASQRARIRIFKLVAMLVGLSLALGIAEAGLRVMEKASAPPAATTVADPVVGFRAVPNAAGLDARGFRNLTVPPHADVVAIGDSQTWGVNVQAGDAWPQQLGKLSPQSVYNMGVGGYGPDQYLVLTDQALDLTPKTIVVALYSGNDIYDAYSFAYQLSSFADLRLKEPGSDLTQNTIAARADALWNEEKSFHFNYGRKSVFGWTTWLREHTAIGRLVNRNLWWLGADVDNEIDREWARTYPEHGRSCDDDQVRTVLTTAYRLTAVDLDDPRIAEGLRITRLTLTLARQKTQGRANLVVLLIPTKELVYSELMRSEGKLTGNYERLAQMETKARQDLMSWCNDNGVTCIDALPALQSAIADRRQIYPTSAESHPLAGGYNIIARVVYDALNNLPR